MGEFSITSFLIINLLNTLQSIILFPIGVLAAILCIKLVHYFTPYDLRSIFDKGVSGGAVIVAASLIGMSIIIAAASF